MAEFDFSSPKPNSMVDSTVLSVEIIKSNSEHLKQDLTPTEMFACTLWGDIFGSIDVMSESNIHQNDDGSYFVGGFITFSEYGFKCMINRPMAWYTLDESYSVNSGTIDLVHPGYAISRNISETIYRTDEEGKEIAAGTLNNNLRLYRYIILDNMVAMIDSGVIFATTKNGLKIVICKDGHKFIVHDNKFYIINFSVNVSSNYDKYDNPDDDTDDNNILLVPAILRQEYKSFIEVGDFIENLYIGPADPVKEKRNFSVGSDSFRWIFNNYYVRYA